MVLRTLSTLLLATATILAAPTAVRAQSTTCGNGVVNVGEGCDPPGSITCPTGSPGGAFQACTDACQCPIAGIDHFQCYGVKPGKTTKQTLQLCDVYGSRSVQVQDLDQLCAPANKNGEDPTAPQHPTHLAEYDIKPQNIPRQDRILNQVLVNQFGTANVDLVSRRAILVPTAKSLTGPPSSPVGSFLDLLCYDVKQSDGMKQENPGTVSVVTQFGTAAVTVKKPHRLCVPATECVQGSFAATTSGLLCYQTKSKGNIGKPNAFIENGISGSTVVTVGQRHELCVPTEVNPSSTTTTSSTSSTSTSTTSTSTTSTSSTSSSTTSTSTSTSTSSTTSVTGAFLMLVA